MVKRHTVVTADPNKWYVDVEDYEKLRSELAKAKGEIEDVKKVMRKTYARDGKRIKELEGALEKISNLECGGNIVGCVGCINDAITLANQVLQEKE